MVGCCVVDGNGSVSPRDGYTILLDRKYSDLATAAFADLQAGKLRPRCLPDNGDDGNEPEFDTVIYALMPSIIRVPPNAAANTDHRRRKTNARGRQRAQVHRNKVAPGEVEEGKRERRKETETIVTSRGGGVSAGLLVRDLPSAPLSRKRLPPITFL